MTRRVLGIAALLVLPAVARGQSRSDRVARGAPPLATAVSGAIPVRCPYGVAVTRGGVAFATSICSHELSRVDVLRLARSREARVGAAPAHVAANRSNTLLFTTNQSEGSVGVVDAKTGEWLATVAIGSGREAYNLLVSPDGRRVYVTTSSPRLLVIDVATRHVVDSATVGSRSNGLAFHPDGRTLYVSSIDERAVVALDSRTLRETGRYELGGRPQRIAVAPDGRTLYASNEHLGFQQLDLASGRVTTLDVGHGAIGLAVRPWADYAYVALANVGEIVVVDLRSGEEHRRLAVGGDPRNMAISSDGSVVVADQRGRVLVLRAPESDQGTRTRRIP